MKKLFTLLTLLVCVCTGAWADETIFSAICNVTTSDNVDSGTTNQEITSSQATITGGSMTVTNNHKDPQKYVDKQGGKGAFCIATSSAYFTITVNQALQDGDKINFILYSSKGNTVGLKLNSVVIGDVTMDSSSPSWTATTEYTVTAGDALIGKTEIKVERTQGKGTYFTDFTITRAAVAPGAISFTPAAGNVATGTSVTLTSSGATTIQYQWSTAAIGSEGDWTGAETYSNNNKPEVPAVGSTNTVLSVKATNANGSTYGSAAYTPVKMALKTIYSLNDEIGSAEVTAGDATITTEGKSLVLSNTAGRIKLTATSGSNFKNGDAIAFSGTIGNTAKKYGISYGSTTNIGTELSVAAGQPCNVSGTLTLASETSDLFIGRADGSTTTMTSFTIRQLTPATSEAFAGVKIGGSAATEDVDYTIDGSTITLSGTFTAAPTVALVNHIVFADESVEDQNLLVAFGAPNGEFFTGTVTIDETTYTVKAPCGQINAIKVEYKDGETTVKEEHIDVTGLKVGASYTVPFRMYVEKDGALYQTTKNSSDPYYGDAVTLAFNTTVTKTVTPVDLGGGTLELLEDLDDTDEQNAGIRASNRSAYNNKAYTSPGTLSPGMYTFIVKAQNKGRGSSVKVGDKTIFTISDINSSAGSWTDKTITDIVIPAEGHVTLVKGGSNTIDCYDVIIAIRTGISTTIANSGYSSLGSAYGLDFANATTSTENAAKLTAFAATESSQTSVKLVSIDEAPAATGVILKGTPGATYTIPVKADAAALTVTNLLHAAVTATDIEANTSYIMQGGQFHLVTADSTVPAGKAYLQAGGGKAGAKALSVVFANDMTGITNANAAEEIAQPAKRIVNGQLVIEKSGKRYNAAGAEF